MFISDESVRLPPVNVEGSLLKHNFAGLSKNYQDNTLDASNARNTPHKTVADWHTLITNHANVELIIPTQK